jgi:hypothetical protein
MQKQRRNRASTKTSVEDEIAHLRGMPWTWPADIHGARKVEGRNRWLTGI